LASRPPISIPLSTISPALLEELISDLSSLASAYHKPASTFIGKVKYGADSAKKGTAATREQALATVVQGQNAENLLDFGEDDVQSSTGGLGALDEMILNDTHVSAPGQTNSTAAASSQLNDLLGL
jgi:hypothetical protein